ncbi:phospholipase/carboxylesterase family protein [Oleiphilus messinensis]|uniref:Phospholipase/carboxylesterase family protein n=1 Tax=Oleiphilus messinensis TaxID=141451 RepID=A0A1Y0IBH1_9GAMM|nr:dienelactone hydrolase family protein [Oleiphilus messinensis]ARU57858.1 phospholipase/carboxylesterase family protein [Oleiphilus messinensis]
MDLLPHIEVEPAQEATASVIWLHGLGADGHDFEPIVPELGLSENHGVRFIFPHAPAIPVTINGGYVMPAWYDILEMNIQRRVDESQLRISAQSIRAFIERELNRGIPSERIILAGFSQGGAVAYETALTYPKPLAGLLALSTYFATADSITLSDANKALPISIMHGTLDPIVPEMLGQQAYQVLTEKGYAATYKTYPMEHNVCPPQIKDIGHWITTLLE